ncbi:hypothetical protein Tco_0153755 [Tanacetum coccineum]
MDVVLACGRAAKMVIWCGCEMKVEVVAGSWPGNIAGDGGGAGKVREEGRGFLGLGLVFLFQPPDFTRIIHLNKSLEIIHFSTQTRSDEKSVNENGRAQKGHPSITRSKLDRSYAGRASMDVKVHFCYGQIEKRKMMESSLAQDKYVADILKKFDFATVKTTSTPIETNKALLKDEEAADVDVHLYRSMIG